VYGLSVPQIRICLESAAAAIGVCLWALFLHSRSAALLLSGLGLLLTTGAFYHWTRSERRPFAVLALGLSTRRAVAVSVAGAVLGVVLGVVYRQQYGWPLLPARLTLFAALAALIGAMEELLYRGYVQGRARRLGVVGAVAFAAACHAAYKSCLFALAPVPIGVAFWNLALVSFVAGVAFGALRELAGSLWPALLAHAAFDIIVYGGYAQPPWWVWQ